MSEENFSPEQSIKVIQSMIEKTKQNLKDNAFFFLLWGWLVFTTAILHFILLKFTNFQQSYLVWNLMIIGMVASIVKGVKTGRSEVVKTFIGEAMKYFGISMGIIYCSLAFIFGYYDLWIYSYPVYILIYAAACFFMGSLMQFRFLQIAGIACLPIMVVSVYVSFSWQLLLLSAAVLIGYIIPGHILQTHKANK